MYEPITYLTPAGDDQFELSRRKAVTLLSQAQERIWQGQIWAVEVITVQVCDLLRPWAKQNHTPMAALAAPPQKE